MHQQQIYHTQQMQSQYEANTRMIMQQMTHMQSAMKQSDLLTTTGVEQWVIDEEINADFPDPAKWRLPLASEGKGRLEDGYEQNIRCRLWVYLTSIIPKPV